MQKTTEKPLKENGYTWFMTLTISTLHNMYDNTTCSFFPKARSPGKQLAGGAVLVDYRS